MLPVNLSPEFDDADRDWTFKNNRFDLINFGHLAWMKDWETMFREAYRCLKPGGYVEVSWLVVEAELNNPQHEAWNRWRDLSEEIFKETGRILELTRTIDSVLQKVGFSLVSSKRESRTLAQMGLHQACDEFDVQGQVLLPLRDGLGWEVSDINHQVERMQEQLPFVRLGRYVLSSFYKTIANV